ncbi:hypothetical protein KIW84_070485 [Lathyrus oleraceus]|uniref:Retrotransposon gag domain-containing protein n=1 Tax=Pisum sativum TaxID=3888 RepID=A0A9D4VFU9_PEA|nr:hypothetical protein KIW84_070485 [Pisum sativum]
MDMAPDRDQLRVMSQKDKETFIEYAQRWRELAAQIVPPLEEKEMTKIFLKTLSSFYYERMIASAPSDFTEMVNMGMLLEGVREGRLTREEDSSAKRYGKFGKKKDGEAHDVTSHAKPRIPSVRRKTVRPAGNQHQWWCKPELHCVYHSGAPGHDVEKCYPLKTKVQDLVRCGILCFEDVCPNVKKNPLPKHGKSSINMVHGCPGKYKVKYVSHIRQSLVDMHRLLCECSHYEHDHDRCRVCTVNQRGCRQVHKDIQEMLDEGVIEILQNRNVYEDDDEVNVISPVFRIPEPVVIKYDGSKQKASPSLIIKPAGPVPYSSDKDVPYCYNVVAVEDGKEVPLPSTSVVNIADISGLTHSGRFFSTPPKPQVDVRMADVADYVERPVGTVVNASNPALVANKPASVVRRL